MRIIGIVIFVLAVMIVSPVLAGDSEDKTISGTVASLDWVKSVLSVRTADPYNVNVDQVSCRVTSDAELSRGTDSISLSDIEEGDPVSVTYYRDDLSGLKVRRLSDLNNASE